MIPIKTVEELISTHPCLEKDIPSSGLEKKRSAEKSKECSYVNEIREIAK